MANQFASISSAAGILKNWYAGALVSQFNDQIPLWKNIEKGREKSAGLQVIRALKVRRNPGVGSTSDGGVLPKIGQQTTVQAAIAYKFNYLRFGVTGPMLKASQGDKGAFVSIMEYEMEQGLLDFKTNFNRQLFGDGSGQIATVAANAVATNVITATGIESTMPGNLYLDVGVVIDIYTSAGVLVSSGLQVTAISGTDTVTLTLSANVTTSATDLIILSGSYQNDVQGLLYTLGSTQTSTIYSVDRSTYTSYQSNIINANGGQLTLDLLQQAWNEGRRRGDAKYNAVFCDYNSERFYNKLLVVDRRYVGKVPGDGTFSNKESSYLEYGGVPITPDKDSFRRFFFLDTNQWKKYVLSELEWADETGSYMIAQVSSDQFEIRLRHLANLFCEKPSAQAVLRNYVSP